MKISLCMIVRDEEEVLKRCLESAKGVADEIIIADTGSVDGSREIAAAYTPFVYDFKWVDDFSAARNFALSKASGDYLLWLDADDVIADPEKGPELKNLLRQEQPDLVMCPYEVGLDGEGRAASSFYRERLLRREANFRFEGRVHECVSPRGKILRFPLRILHLGSRKERGMRNLKIYQKWAEEEPLSPRDKFYYGRELYYHAMYAEAIAVLREMLSGEGWYVNKIDACRTLGLCHAALGRREEARSALLNSFLYGEPRGFVCCELGRLFRLDGRLHEAAFWYESALRCRDHSAEGDFEEPDCRGITPLLELVCIYYALGDRKAVLECHKKTEELSPRHPSVLFNCQFFKDHPL